MNVLHNGTLVIKRKLLKDYDMTFDQDGISGERVATRLEEIAGIGLTKDGGSNRPGFSKEEQAAKEKVMHWMRDLGMDIKQDGAGNVFGRLQGKDDSLPYILCGSHLDTVPNGGHFDGVLGVLAALEVAEAWHASNYLPERSFEIAIFTDEEGSRFNASFTGSEAVVGVSDMADKLALVDTEGNPFTEVLDNIGLNQEGYEQAKQNLDHVALFAEVHIEQGKTLEKENLPCGIVTGIAGPCWLEVIFHGEAGHAGNTPMDDRRDALIATSEFISKIHPIPKKASKTAVATVGKLFVYPNGINVIPGKVTAYVDVRDIYQATRDQIVEEIHKEARNISEKYDIPYEIKELANVLPVLIKEKHIDGLSQSLEHHGLQSLKLPSGAGHDAMMLSKKTDAAMLFTKSKDGISHNPAEWSDLNDCMQTIHVLKTFIEKV